VVVDERWKSSLSWTAARAMVVAVVVVAAVAIVVSNVAIIFVVGRWH
jgi:hypothetical protein